WVLIGGGLIALTAGLIIVSRIRHPTVTGVPVTINSELTGASISVAGKTCLTPGCVLTLSAGSYKLTATKTGYKRVAETLVISPGQAAVNFPVVFEPLPQILQVNTNFETGQVFLDHRVAGDLVDGQFSISNVSTGLHTLRVAASKAEFQMEWKNEKG